MPYLSSFTCEGGISKIKEGLVTDQPVARVLYTVVNHYGLSTLKNTTNLEN